MMRQRAFTLLEMMIASALFVAGSVYVYATFTGVTESSQRVTMEIDLGSQNKRGLTRLFAELQASSVAAQDTDGLDSTDPVAVMIVENDDTAPLPATKVKVVSRSALPSGGIDSETGAMDLGHKREQARERLITVSKRLRFRKVIGYQFNAGAGSIVPEWSPWITVELDDERQLVRTAEGGKSRVIASRVDAFDVEPKPDGTVLLTLITARQDPMGHGWRRYANSVTVHPKN